MKESGRVWATVSECRVGVGECGRQSGRESVGDSG